MTSGATTLDFTPAGTAAPLARRVLRQAAFETKVSLRNGEQLLLTLLLPALVLVGVTRVTSLDLGSGDRPALALGVSWPSRWSPPPSPGRPSERGSTGATACCACWRPVRWRARACSWGRSSRCWPSWWSRSSCSASSRCSSAGPPTPPPWPRPSRPCSSASRRSRRWACCWPGRSAPKAPSPSPTSSGCCCSRGWAGAAVPARRVRRGAALGGPGDRRPAGSRHRHGRRRPAARPRRVGPRRGPGLRALVPLGMRRAPARPPAGSLPPRRHQASSGRQRSHPARPTAAAAPERTKPPWTLSTAASSFVRSGPQNGQPTLTNGSTATAIDSSVR